MRFSRSVAVGLGVAFSAMFAASVAWACTPSAQISARPGSGRGGDQITVVGGAWDTLGPIDIHWNSVDGPVLASASGSTSDFSVSVRIPEVAPDIYTIVATQPRLGGGVTKAAAAFQVTTTGGGAGATSSSGQTTTRASGGSGRSVASSSPPASSGSDQAGEATEVAPSVVTPAPGAVATGDPTTSGRAATAASGARNGASASSPAAGDTRAPVTQAGAPPVAVRESGDQTPAPLSTSALVSNDLWGGFTSTSGLGVGPSLVEAPAAGHPSVTTAGLAVFSFALVALFAGFGLAEARRRRVSASTS